jgi:hypothetical protein
VNAGPEERVYEALCGKDRIWIGHYNATAVQFTPHSINGYYDAGRGHASKSFTDPLTGRRLLWSWIESPVVANGANTSGVLMDGYMSVPREVTWDNVTQQLLINPVAEVTKLRRRQLTPSAAGSAVAGTGTGIGTGGIEVVLRGEGTGVNVPGCSEAGDALDIIANFTLPPAAQNTKPVDGSTSGSIGGEEEEGVNLINVSFGVRFRVGVGAQPQFAEARFNLTRSSSAGDGSATMAVSPAEGSAKLVPVTLVRDEALTQQVFSMRLLVDRPVVEVYAQYGRLRMSVPMRLPISNGSNSSGYGAGVQVFGPAGASAEVSVWQMGSAFAAAPPHL